MVLNESGALEVTAVRALETSDRSRTFWTDADRAWAGRAAAEVVGEGGTPQAFLVARARLVLERMGERTRLLLRSVHALRWCPWVGNGIVIAAFLAGVAIDRIGDTSRINVLAPPVLALLAWNLAVYALLVLAYVRHFAEPARPGPLRRAIIWLAGGLLRRRGGELSGVLAQFADGWARIAGALYAARLARILHLAAAALVIGLLAGLYLRGIALEYRANWQSTFLDAERVRRLLAIVLAPGAALTGIELPTVAQIESIRAPAEENAARWLHLMAATLAAVVIVPRLLLALFAGLLERYRSTHVPLAVDEPYFQRLLRGFHAGPVRVDVIPYSYTLPPAVVVGLEQLIAGVYGGSAALTICASVDYGAEDSLADGPDYAGNVIALFSATATPERATHGAFLAAIGARLGPAGTLIGLVEESSLRNRWGSEPARLAERRRLWRELCADQHVPCAFADLAVPEIVQAEGALELALEEAAR